MSSGFPIEVLLFPMIILITLGGLFLLGHFLKTRVESEMKQVGAEARRIDAQRRELNATLDAFDDVDQEPFLSRVSALGAILEDVNARAALLQNERIQVRQRAASLNSASWRVIMGAPYLWYALERDVRRLLAGMDRVDQLLQAARQKEDEIHRLGWSIAQQARQARLLQRQARKAMDALQARKLGGAAFEKALAEESRLGARLGSVPEYLFNDSEERVLELLDRETTTAAHNAVEEVRPGLEALLEQAGGWSRQAGRADEQVNRLRRALEDVEQTLTSLPVGVDASDARTRLSQMDQIARSLEATLTRLEVESIDELAAQAENQARLAQELSQALKRARREAPALQAALVTLAAGFKDISTLTTALSKVEKFPVRWRPSTSTLGDLNRQASQLGDAERARPPEQIQKDLETAAGLRSRQTELAGKVQQIRDDHARLLAQLAAEEFAGLQAWLDETHRLIEKISGYDPENWSRQEAVGRLPADIDALAAEARRLELFKPETRLDENQVAQRLADVLALASTIQSLHRRVDTVRARLEILGQQEQQTAELLENTSAMLSQIEFVVKSNDFLGGAAAQELERFSTDLTRLGEEAADRGRGRVDARLRQAEMLAERIEIGANRWLELLMGEIEAQNDDLGALLKELDEIAALDEQPIADARRLLSSGAALPRSSYAGRGRLNLEALLPELKRRSDYWHSANAAMRAMEDFRPLIETFQEAAYQRDQAHRTLTDVGSGMRQRRTWPPTTVSLDAEREELKKIEAQWQELQNSHTKAIARTAQLGGLAARCQALTERVLQAAERADREGGEVEDQEISLNELTQAWQNNLYDVQEYPEAAAEIQALLEETSKEIAQIRRRYQQGSTDYNQVLQSMKKLNQRVRYFQIALDDERSMNIDGKIQVRREGKNVRGKYY